MSNEDQPQLINEPVAVYTPDPEKEKIREEYRARLAEKLKDPEFRKIEGFPIGTDEAILALSDPPYYTACPNPFIEEWLKEHGKPFDPDTDDYHREPFAADVSEGKNHPIYNAHSYHTKVPHRAIMRYILHYTEPGDVVYDGFCGTGMTGVAAQFCGDRREVEEMGYRVDSDGFVWERKSWDAKEAIASGGPNPHAYLTEPSPVSKIGARKAIVSDLSPVATFIAHNYNCPVDSKQFELEARRILSEVKAELSWMYETAHSPSSVGRINFTVWSEVLSCPACSGEIVFKEVAFDPETQEMRDQLICPHCTASVTKNNLELLYDTHFEPAIGTTVKTPKRQPVLINYSVGKTRYEKIPDSADLETLKRIAQLPQPANVPTTPIPPMQMMKVGRMQPVSITHIHQFFIARTAHILSSFWSRAERVLDIRLRSLITFWLESQLVNLSVRNRYRPGVSFPYNPMTGVFYVPSMLSEASVFTAYENKLKRIVVALDSYSARPSQVMVETGSAGCTRIIHDSIDYIFTDPPFGENIYYSDLNFFTEAWLGVMTSTPAEAIVDRVKSKTLTEYQKLMQDCFAEYYRVLKPGHWMTVEFHNSQHSVWNSIQEALQYVGFVVADVRMLDKKLGSFQQVNSGGATKKDLVISCYKPTARFVRQFEEDKGTPKGVREFIEQHLEMLPVAPTTTTGSLESLAERTLGVLFDRMIAYHLVRGARIPLSASEFRVLLEDLCYERDGMYFLPSQVVHYDALKSRGIEVEQLSIFVRDEKSAVHWVRNELGESPQTLGELTPKFMQASQDWGTHEVMPELKDLLHQYFIREDDENWVVPDPDNEKHLEEVRRKSMLREFQEYVRRTGQLKLFRTEAVLAGFAHCWDSKQYDVIVGVCEKIPPKILQEIQDLVMFYDIAKEKAPEKISQFEFKWE